MCTFDLEASVKPQLISAYIHTVLCMYVGIVEGCGQFARRIRRTIDPTIHHAFLFPFIYLWCKYNDPLACMHSFGAPRSSLSSIVSIY